MKNKLIVSSLIYSLLWLISLCVIAIVCEGYIVSAGNSITYISIITLCVFTLFQTAFEEAVFRLVPLFIYKKCRALFKTNDLLLKWMIVVIPAAVFSLLHIKNREVISNPKGHLILLIYFVAGCYYMYITLKHNSIFPSWGMHYINNIFTFAVVSSASSSSPFNPLYICTIKEDNMLFMLSSLAFSVVFTQVGYKVISSVLLRENR